LTADTSNGTTRRDFLTTTAAGVATASTLLSLNAAATGDRVGSSVAAAPAAGGAHAAMDCVQRPGRQTHAWVTCLINGFARSLIGQRQTVRRRGSLLHRLRRVRAAGAQEIDVVILAAPPGFRPPSRPQSPRRTSSPKPVRLTLPLSCHPRCGCRGRSVTCRSSPAQLLHEHACARS
jgi:hypothetical protein